MEERIYDFWAAALQDGYINDLPKIVTDAGGARSFYEMSCAELKERCCLSDRMIKHIINRRNNIDIERDYEKMLREKIGFTTYKDADYPMRLNSIPDRPYALFYKGCLPDDDTYSAAIIGARNCSSYGRLMAEYFGNRLAGCNVNIVSGMAYGIDGIAQMSAIDAGGKSYGILGCGVDVVYPRSNAALYERLSCDGNGLISEYAPGTMAQSRNFPPRNRIISGLSDVLIVVEAKAKSGTFITVNMALEQNREVLVVPGRITDPLSVGCLNLLNIGAGVALSADSVLQVLGAGSAEGYATAVSMQTSPAIFRRPHLNGTARLIYDNLDFNPKSVNDLADATNLIIPVVLTNLTQLEMEGYARDIGGGYFVLGTNGH